MSNLDDFRVLRPVQTTTERKATEFDGRGSKTWLDPIMMSQLQKAVKENRKTVILGGLKYNITYGIKIKLPASGGERDCVKLKRADGQMAPFGYVSLERIRSFDFETDE